MANNLAISMIMRANADVPIKAAMHTANSWRGLTDFRGVCSFGGNRLSVCIVDFVPLYFWFSEPNGFGAFIERSDQR